MVLVCLVSALDLNDRFYCEIQEFLMEGIPRPLVETPSLEAWLLELDSINHHKSSSSIYAFVLK